MKVNLLIIGAMKCGTTTMSTILNEHPDISVAKNKEPHFFSKAIGDSSLEQYHNLYIPGKKWWCDASTTYSCFPEFNPNVVRDIYDYNPNMKIIYIVREPIERTVSNYMHLYQRGYTDLTLKDAVLKETGLINRGKYYMQLKPYIDYFGRDRILILDFEQLKKIDALVRKVLDFLPAPMPANFEVNQLNKHVNKSLNTLKRHHKLDNLENSIFYKTIRPIVPSNLYQKLVTHKIKEKSRVFVKKPTVSEDIENLIYRLLETDLKRFKQIAEIKPKWFDRF